MIALEYFEQINENPFVLDVVIETAVTDIKEGKKQFVMIIEFSGY